MSSLTIDRLKYLINAPRPVFLEIGANTGRDSNRFLENIRGLLLYCFEPDPRCIRKFKKHMVASSNCRLIEAAISDEDGEATFHLSSGSRPGHKSVHINSSSLFEPTGHLTKFPWCKFDEKITVKTMRLDTWYEKSDLKTIDFIWADVQGTEEQMISGGLNTIGNTRYFYTEFSDKELYEGQISLGDILKMLPMFEVSHKFKTNVLLKNKRL